MIEIINKNGHRYAKVKDLHKWEDNPRRVEKADFARLKKQLELGEHSTLLVMPDGTVLGGNTRLEAYQAVGKELAKIILVHIKQEGKRWVAEVDGERAPKTFDTPEQAKLEYALSHNDQIARYDDSALAEMLHVTPIEMEVYKVPMVVTPVEDVAFEAGPGVNPEDREQDENTIPTEKLDAYMNGNIKQIVLYFSNEEYAAVIPRIEKLRQDFKVENNTELFLSLVDTAEGKDGRKS